MTKIGSEYWNKWLATENCRCVCQTMVPCKNDPSNNVIQGWEDDCLIAFQEQATDEWLRHITRTHAKRGHLFGGYRNKLRSYTRF